MIQRGTLNVPVIGVARSGWSLEKLRARARASLEEHGGFDPGAFDKLCSKPGPSIPPEKFATLEHLKICGSTIPRLDS